MDSTTGDENNTGVTRGGPGSRFRFVPPGARLSAAFVCLVLFRESGVAAALPRPIAGWRIALVAEAPKVRHPSVVACAPDGRVFVAEDPMDISLKGQP